MLCFTTSQLFFVRFWIFQQNFIYDCKSSQKVCLPIIYDTFTIHEFALKSGICQYIRQIKKKNEWAFILRYSEITD